MMRFYKNILATLVTLLLGIQIVSASPLNQSSVGDRIFLVNSTGGIIERRHVQGSWHWITHEYVNNELENSAYGPIKHLGPLMCNGGVCRLYITTENDVVEYNFEQYFAPGATQTVTGTYESYNRVTALGWACDSNIIYDRQWQLHCLAKRADGGATLHKYDLLGAEIDDVELATSGETEDSSLRFSVFQFDDDNIAYNVGGIVYITYGEQPLNVARKHPINRRKITSLGGAAGKDLFALGNKRIFKIAHNGKRYDWERVKKPNYVEEFNAYQPLVQIGEDKWVFIATYKESLQQFVAEYVKDSEGEWQWVDHGNTISGAPTRIIDPYPKDSSFFVLTDRNILIQRHFRTSGSFYGWVWDTHGLVP